MAAAYHGASARSHKTGAQNAPRDAGIAAYCDAAIRKYHMPLINMAALAMYCNGAA